MPSEDEYIENPKFSVLHNEKKWSKYELIDDLFNDVDAVVILTEWDIYSHLDWNLISKKMRAPGWVFDSRLIVDNQKVLASGLNLWRVGDGTLNENVF